MDLEDPNNYWMYTHVGSAVEAHSQALERKQEREGDHEEDDAFEKKVSIMDTPRRHAQQFNSDGTPMGVLVQIPKESNTRRVVVQVAVGAEHGVLLTDIGKIYTWGDNRYGQLGRDPVLKEERKEAFLVPDMADDETIQVAAGVHHCLALSSAGVVRSWGRNKAGQLGQGHNKDVTKPDIVRHAAGADGREEPLGSREGERITAIGAGTVSSVAASANSQVWQWGAISEQFKAPGEGGATVPKNRPFCMFDRDKFMPGIRDKAKKLPVGGAAAAKRLADRAPEQKVSITASGCRVLLAGAEHDNVKDLIDSLEVLKGTIFRERAAQLRQGGGGARGRGGDESAGATGGASRSDPGALHDLGLSIAALDRETGDAERDIVTLEKNLAGMTARQEHIREQLTSVSEQNTQLSQNQDELALLMFDARKGSGERKRLQDRLTEIRRFLDSNQITRDSLNDQKSATDKEKQRLQLGLHEKRQSLTKQRHRLRTLKDLSKAVSTASGASDGVFKLLKESKDEFNRHFVDRAVENDFVAAMQEFEYDGSFLRGVEVKLREIPQAVSASHVRAMRGQLVADLLQDLVSLRRSWNDMLQNRWAAEDLDLSCFFRQDGEGVGAPV